MGTVPETIAATLCVLGLMGCFWWLTGRLLRPLPCGNAFILLRGRGEGDALEQSVRGFIWLRGLGLLKAPILIVDLGLSQRGREIALRLCARWPGVILWPGEDLGAYLNSDQ